METAGNYTFVIQNIGDAPLILSGAPVEIFGADPFEFRVERQPSSPILPGEMATFDVRFEPFIPGYKSAMLSIWNNDPDENPYEFMLSGYAEEVWLPMRLILTDPNGEEVLLAGSPEKIVWKGEETIKEVKIEYSTDNGSSYRQVSDRAPNTGSHEWSVPYGASPSCLVRVSDADGAPASPEIVSFAMKFKISATEEARGPESHLKMRFGIPDAWTQGFWFTDLEFFPDRSTGTERLVFNQLAAECRSLEKFLNTWHVIEVQYDMNAYSASMWLDGALIFQKAPLQVSFPMLPSAEISLSAGPEARAEIWVDDVALKIGSRSFAQRAEASDEPLFLILARDSFEAYGDNDMLKAGGWQVADKAVSGDQVVSAIDAQESVSGLQSLKLKALDGHSLTAVKSFSLPERFPFDVSDGNFAITDGKMAAAELQELKVQQSLRGQELMRERLQRRGTVPLLEDRLRSRKSSEMTAPLDEAGGEDHGTGILSIHPNGTYYIYGYDGKLLAEYDGLGNCVRDYIYVGGRLFAEYRPQENKLYYYLSDQISSTRMITDQTGTVVYSAAHGPYGGIQKTWVSTYDPALKFSGKERDEESGLDYFGARYFYTGHYRWLSVDPVINREEALANPQLWNLYAYCRNSPITYWDPDGMLETSLTKLEPVYDKSQFNSFTRFWASGRIEDNVDVENVGGRYSPRFKYHAKIQITSNQKKQAILDHEKHHAEGFEWLYGRNVEQLKIAEESMFESKEKALNFGIEFFVKTIQWQPLKWKIHNPNWPKEMQGFNVLAWFTHKSMWKKWAQKNDWD